jgi:starvation-inducible DNA-binding protein
MAKKTTRSSSTSPVTSDADAPLTVPGLDTATGHAVADALQMRVHALNDLQLTLKHAHWNVVGPHFIGVHEMLDPQIDGVRAMVDALAERMSTLGVPPNGLPGALVAARTWDDYDLHRADTTAHLAALDLVYTGVIEDHRAAIEAVGDDPVTEDLLTGQTGELEQYQWFVRAHLQGTSGALASAGAEDEVGAARKATRRAARKR